MEREEVLPQAAQLIRVLTQRASHADTLRTLPLETVEVRPGGHPLQTAQPIALTVAPAVLSRVDNIHKGPGTDKGKGAGTVA